MIFMTTRTRWLTLAGLLTLGFGASLAAQAPDLSGTWKLNSGASQLSHNVGLTGLGGGGAPKTLYITQAANGTLTVGSDVNESMARAYAVGGESTVPLVDGRKLTAPTRWMGRMLVTEGAGVKESMAISPDGQTLIVTVTLTTSAGAATSTLSYVKTLTEDPCQAWPTPCRRDSPRR